MFASRSSALLCKVLCTCSRQFRRQLFVSTAAASGAAQPSQRHDHSDRKCPVAIAQDVRGKQIRLQLSGSSAEGLHVSKRDINKPTSTCAREVGTDGGVLQLLASAAQRARGLAQATFLPAGYPHTVGEHYLQYVVWQGLGNFAVSANSVLASTFLLYSVGLGDGAIPTAGALNWVLKDGLGQLGTLVFGKTIAHNFDIHSKSWYFLSMAMLKVATGLEILTLLAPHYFLFMGSAANCIKGLSFMANGSTRSVFNLSYVRDNNIADITAKGTSQYILASMCGTVAGAWLCACIGQDLLAATLGYSLLTVSTLVAAYKTVKAIPLATLNNTRLQLLCESFLSDVRAAAVLQHQRQAAAAAAAAGAGGAGGAAGAAGSGADYHQHHFHHYFYDHCQGAPPFIMSLQAASPTGPAAPAAAPASEAQVAAAQAAAASEVQPPAQPAEPQLAPSAAPQPAAGSAAAPVAHPAASPPAPASPVAAASAQPAASPSPPAAQPAAEGAAQSAAAAAAAAAGGAGAQGQGQGPHAFAYDYEPAWDEMQEIKIATPTELAAEDPPLPFLMGDQRILNPAIIVGTSLVDAIQGNAALLVVLLSTFHHTHYLVWPSITSHSTVHVILHQAATPRDICQAYLQACLIRRRIREGGEHNMDQLADMHIALQDTLALAQRLTAPFMASLSACGWRLERVVVEANKQRARW